ncbi:hypothetical protein J6S88_03995 [bacterium]|nr:hypothetical protein [bacterium]
MLKKSEKKEIKSNIKSGKSNNYMTDINGLDKMSFNDVEAKLKSQVIDQLKAEFPGIENKKSFGLLVDAVINNIKNKDIRISDNRQA